MPDFGALLDDLDALDERDPDGSEAVALRRYIAQAIREAAL